MNTKIKISEAAQRGRHRPPLTAATNSPRKSEAANPPKMEWFNASGKPANATFPTDYRYFELLAKHLTDSHQAMFTAEGMVQKLVGAGSQYLAAYKDGDGNWLDGSQSYSLHVNPDVPVEDFWSVMVYDAETRSMIVNGQVPGRDSNAKLKTSSDGSVDLYFGPTAPEGLESNWVKTIPGKGFFLYFRFYGLKKEFFDLNWTLDDLKKN